MFLNLRSLSHPQRAPVAILASVAFVLGLLTASLVGPIRASGTFESATAEFPRADISHQRPIVSGAGYPARVLRVIDGDTFEARVPLWPGLEITTKVRLRGIDAPEMHARCSAERVKAEAARDALAALLAQGRVGISRVGQDKYGGRVDADVSTARTADVSEALLTGGFARRYDGGRRGSWCDRPTG